MAASVVAVRPVQKVVFQAGEVSYNEVDPAFLVAGISKVAVGVGCAQDFVLLCPTEDATRAIRE